MSDTYTPVTPYEGGTGSNATSGTADVAKEQAANVKDTATDAGKQVAGVAKDEVGNVASEAKTQAKDLLGQAKSQLSDQATNAQQGAATGLSGLSDQLRKMASSSEAPGFATDLINQAADRAEGAASWLEGKDPSGLLDDVSDFARRRPGLFIGIAALTGVVVGRLTRSIVTNAADDKAAAAATPSPASLSGSSYYAETPVTTPASFTAAGVAATPDYSAESTPIYAATDAGDSTYSATEGELTDPSLSVDNEPYRGASYGNDRP